MAADGVLMPCLLIDTNIWLDMYIPHRKGGSCAAELVEVAQANQAVLAFASHACLDVFQRVSFELKRWVRENGELSEEWAQAIKRYAWDCVNDMQEVATAIPVDSSDLYLACKYRDRHDDLEDDLVLSSCQRAGANYLVTNDKKLMAHAPLEAKTAEEMLQLFKAGMVKSSTQAGAPKDATYWMYQWLRGT